MFLCSNAETLCHVGGRSSSLLPALAEGLLCYYVALSDARSNALDVYILIKQNTILVDLVCFAQEAGRREEHVGENDDGGALGRVGLCLPERYRFCYSLIRLSLTEIYLRPAQSGPSQGTG